MGAGRTAVQGYYNTRKRTFYSLSRKKPIDLQKEMEEDLLAMEEVDKEACWKIYRLEEANCVAHVPPNPKTKNCKQNPYCIHRLGLEKFDKLLQSQQTPQNLVRRNPAEQPCGLANFGNFCYVNSFLQIWFNDLQFRQCIYNWRPSTEWEKPETVKLDIQEVMQCLQRLFITMQFTPFDSTNANEFIQLLRLDNEQQDVQEFHTLFFGTIESNLHGHPNGEPIIEAIRRLFQSRISQTIECGYCHRKSVTEGEYRSLQIGIDGHDSLISAIKQFFAAESLEDCRCDQCGISGSVTRTSKFVQFPEVLIIQLNRYVFDNNGRHRKLKTPIHYPRTLPIGELNKNVDGDDYELCAVMIHEGQSTHCGHYYDLIRDPESGQWFKYNDKEVVPEKRALGYAGKLENLPRASADTKGCYALIYQRSYLNRGNRKLQLPPENVVEEVRNKLEDDFARQSNEGSRSLELWTNRIKSRNEFLHQLWAELEVFDGKKSVDHPEDISFIPTSLLADILTNEYKAVEEYIPTDSEYAYLSEPVSNITINLCKHGFVPLEGIPKGELKAVHTEAARKLIEEFNVQIDIANQPKTHQNSNELGQFEQSASDYLLQNGELTNGAVNVRLKTGADICVECVEAVRKGALFKNTLNRTEEHFSAIMKKECLQDRIYEPTRINPEPRLAPPDDAVWVSLSHLRSFKKLAIRQMEQDGKLFCSEDEPSDKKSKGEDHSEDGEVDCESSQQKRKDDIICLDADEPSTSNVHNMNRDFSSNNENFANSYQNGMVKPMAPIEEQDRERERDERHGSEEKENGEGRDSPSEGGAANNDDEAVNGHIPSFNDALLCKHHKLNPKTKRVWLTREEWGILSNNFFNCCDPILCTDRECGECIEETQVLSEVKESSKKQLENLLIDIGNLLKIWKERKNWHSEQLGCTFDHVICQKFLDNLKISQQRLRTKNLPDIPKICQECMLCDLHNIPYLSLNGENSSPLYQLDEFKKQQISPGLPITELEWQELVEIYKKHVPEHGEPLAILLQENGRFKEFCDDCHFEHNVQEVKKQFIYPEGADIYVKLKGDESEDQLQAKTASYSTATVTTRRVASKGLLKFKMSSDQTVHDLKLRLYERIKQSPVDQLLYRNGQVLEGDLTLQLAEVPFNNVDNPLILIVQQGNRDDIADTLLGNNAGGNAQRPLEKGFKDTALSA